MTAPLLIRALRGEPVERAPVWFMRQAGRALREYRALRRARTLFEPTVSPELTAEVTLQPICQPCVDAAIFSSDIVLPLAPAGVEREIRAGTNTVGAFALERLRVAARLRGRRSDVRRRLMRHLRTAEARRYTRDELPLPDPRRETRANSVSNLP